MARSELSSQPRLRSDAQHNRDRIVQAAVEVFAYRGPDASMAEIARRAEVGMATLFRRFPSKEALLREVFADTIAACDEGLRAAAAAPDPWSAFAAAVEGLFQAQTRARGLASEIIASFLEGDGFQIERDMVEGNLTRLIERAAAVGALREGLGYPDVMIMLKANAGVIALSGEEAEAASRRFVATMLQAFRAGS